MTEKISRLIDELLAYGVNAGLVDKEDETYTRNKLNCWNRIHLVLAAWPICSA